MKQFLASSALISALLSAPFVGATNSENINADAAYFSLGVGSFDVFDEDFAAVDLSYRTKTLWKDLRLSVGFMGNQESDIYAYVGPHYTFNPYGNFYISPSIVAGFYNDGAGVDLGGPVEFRSGLEVGYALKNQLQLGVQYTHLSNASLYEDNSGTETLMLTIAKPL